MATIESVYGQTWYAASTLPAHEHEILVRDRDVDVCVIGGGLAGLTVARELGRRGWSVAVLEAQRVAWNASGRNTGFVAAGFSEQPERIIARVGFARAKALWELSASGVAYVRKTISETGMSGVEPVDGWLNVQRYDDEAELAARAGLLTELGTPAEVWPTERVRAVLKTKAYHQGLLQPEGFHIHALNYALGLVTAAEAAGVAIFEHSPAVAIDPTGVRKLVHTPKGRVRANHIVLAGNTHLAPLLPLVAEAVLPLTTYVAVTAPLEGLAEAIAYPGAVMDTRRVFDYYRIVEGNRLMWGARVSAREGAPAGLAKVFRRDIRKVYPQLGEVEITHAWAGTMGYALHRMPLIGEVEPGLWVATAFGGHGINTSAMAGQMIAAALAEGDDRWRLFSSYDLVWAGGRLGLSAAQAVYTSKRVRDVVEEKLAHFHHKSRLRTDMIAARNAAAEAARREAEETARHAAEEAARVAAEDKTRRAKEAAERRAADEAAQIAAEEARWLAAESAARHTSEQTELQAAVAVVQPTPQDEPRDASAEWRAVENLVRPQPVQPPPRPEATEATPAPEAAVAPVDVPVEEAAPEVANSPQDTSSRKRRRSKVS